MNQGTVNIILLAAPIVIGGLIAAINANGINDATEKVEAWARKRQQAASVSSGWFSNYIINPLLWVIVKFCEWTDDFTHRGLKNGIRIAATLYIIAAWLFVLYVAVVVVIYIAVIAVMVAFIYFLVKVFAGSSDNGQEKEAPIKHSSSIFSRECGRCGSKDHATSDCPQGIFSSKCGRCGSVEHATNDCPHAFFTSECGRCGSKDHATSDCPHGIFSSKCGRCGSVEHATDDCCSPPHYSIRTYPI